MDTLNIELNRRVFGRLILLGAMIAGPALFLAACNTVEGAGEDIQAAGDAIEDTAEDAGD